jgi:hypothetical protein
MKEELELRMYFFVPYNISEIQKGIQAGHAAIEYAHKFGQTELFKEFAEKYKTWIILNGGTTRDTEFNGDIGSLNAIEEYLEEYEIDFASFREPDLNNALTAVCFIADERVFSKDYMSFEEYKNYLINEPFIEDQDDDEMYNDWVENIMDNEKNAALRNLITGKSLA